MAATSVAVPFVRSAHLRVLHRVLFPCCETRVRQCRNIFFFSGKETIRTGSFSARFRWRLILSTKGSFGIHYSFNIYPQLFISFLYIYMRPTALFLLPREEGITGIWDRGRKGCGGGSCSVKKEQWCQIRLIRNRGPEDGLESFPRTSTSCPSEKSGKAPFGNLSRSLIFIFNVKRCRSKIPADGDSSSYAYERRVLFQKYHW